MYDNDPRFDTCTQCEKHGRIVLPDGEHVEVFCKGHAWVSLAQMRHQGRVNEREFDEIAADIRDSSLPTTAEEAFEKHPLTILLVVAWRELWLTGKTPSASYLHSLFLSKN